MNTAKAIGVFEEHGDTLIIRTEINAFQAQAKFMFGVFIGFYILFISIILFGRGSDAPLFVLPFILLHATIMLGVPYFLIRRSVKRMKYDLERDLYYLATKKKAVQV